MKLRNASILLMIIGFTVFSSCKSTILSMGGIKKVDGFDEHKFEENSSYFKKLYPEVISTFSSDTLFKSYMKEFGAFKSHETNQPIQILYFAQDSLVSYHANCYAKPSLTLKLNWNFDGKFDTYFPRTAVPIVENKGLQYLIQNFNLSEPKSSNTIVFFWSTLTERESKRAFKTVIENLNSYAKNDKPTLIAINTDYTFAEFDL